MKKVIVCCGLGGVGKTTVSASLAIQHARAGKKVAVLTIDPAKRLADSMNIGPLSNDPTRVPLDGCFIDAMMLDQAETFDAFTYKYAKTSASAKALIENRYYHFASRQMGGVLEYMAMIRLLDLIESNRYEVVVLDTPPNQNAIDFLEAPEKIEALLERSAIKWLASQRKGWRAFALGAELLSKGLQAFLGEEMIEEIGLFFEHFTSVGAEMHKQAMQCKQMLQSQNTSFYLVTSTDRHPSEILRFHDYLSSKAYPLGGFLINRCMPDIGKPPITDQMPQNAIAALMWAQKITDAERVKQNELKTTLAKSEPCYMIPELKSNINSLEGLIQMSKSLPKPYV